MTNHPNRDRRAEEAAKRFFNKLAPQVAWDYTDHRAKPLVLGAFVLYQRAWDGGRWDIRHWEWPFDTLQRNASFDGDEPWAVLLRRAVEIARQRVDTAA